MKTIKRQEIFILFIGLLLISFSSQSQILNKNKKTDIEVKGNCGMCKKRIETAVSKIKGIKYAQWDIPSKKLTVVMDENKCTIDDIQKVIAQAGHDTETYTAPDSIYNKLPPCCKFRDPKSIELDHGKNK